jgi:[acyl-carrier-protein] S-malonyltransferase
MFRHLAGNAIAESVLEEASSVLGMNLCALVRTQADLFKNSIAQPLFCAAAVATWQALAAELPTPSLFAGYSVGELAAYGCVGAVSVADVAALAVERAALMDKAGTAPAGLVALRGLDRAQVEMLCHQHGAEIAIINGYDRFVVGGPASAIERVGAAAAKDGALVNQLPVSVAAHTSFLSQASPKFEAALRAFRWSAIDVPVLAGIDGTPVRDRNKALIMLSRQISTPINWVACLDTAFEMGCSVFLELGPGSRLTLMARELYPDLNVRSVEEFRSLRGVINWIRKYG